MKNSRGGPLPIVIIMNIILAILIALVVLFVVAFIKELNADSVISTDTSSQVSSDESFDSVSSEDTSSATEDVSQTVSVPSPDSYVVVPESDKVLNSYFDDAVFIGDSLTEGIKLYGVMSNAVVLSGTGLGLDNIYTKEVIEQDDGTKISIMDALEKETDVAKIYILMGPNSIGYNKDTFVSKYGAIIDSVKIFHPNAIVYIQSMLPVTTSYKHSIIDNKLIDEYNLALVELAEEKNVYYLDVNSHLKGPDGALPTEASPKDGMHFGATYYQKWFDYLKTHTVK